LYFKSVVFNDRMASTISRLWTGASFVKNCGEAISTGGKSEMKEMTSGVSCARSTAKLWKQECEEGTIPEQFCPPSWRPQTEFSHAPAQKQEDSFSSSPVQEPIDHSQFQKFESGHSCPRCGTNIEFGTPRCEQCLIKLDWEDGKPRPSKEKIEINDGHTTVQSRSSF